ncbi:MAG: ethylbenzene dehydrogenase-related protein [Burkholderiales bacterium]
MQAIRVNASADLLLDQQAPFWASAPRSGFDMVPVPLPMVEAVSPFLARNTGNGAIKRLDVSAAHNGAALAIAMSWTSGKHDEIKDLNQFVDGVAVMFPLARTATAVTMGAIGAPVNVWFWRANKPAPYSVIAEGFASVCRLPPDEAGDLAASAQYLNGRWTVILRRSIAGPVGHVKLVAGQATKVAFAAWDGGNAERSGRKSFSGEFVDFELAK